MIKGSKKRSFDESSQIGWICTADMLLFTVIIMMALGLVSISESRESGLNKDSSEKPKLIKAIKDLETKLKISELENQRFQTKIETIIKENRISSSDLMLSRKLNSQQLAIIEQLRKDAELLVRKLEEEKGKILEKEQMIGELKKNADRIPMLTIEIDRLKMELSSTIENLKKAMEKNQIAESGRKKINRELIGLKGELNRTAILIDASGSMAGQRWLDAVNVMEVWLEQLPVQKAVLIVFNQTCTSLPEDNKTYFNLAGNEGVANRKRMIDLLRNNEPVGGTFTRGALELAYSREGELIDSIILFTDGAPNTGRESKIVAVEADAIYRLIETKTDIPINAIGIGNYFEPSLSEFLLKISQISKGTFIGR